jgi:flavin reductase (DIM6/NTAB) family NADH-FMN oxidoreductase RutF
MRRRVWPAAGVLDHGAPVAVRGVDRRLHRGGLRRERATVGRIGVFHIDVQEGGHRLAQRAILYVGTPVVLIGTVNEDESYNLAPMSSAFWLGWRCILGMSAASKSSANMLRTHECVLNLPSEREVAAVNRLARTTGSDPVPDAKLKRGYRYEKNKFATAHMTPVASETIAAPRALECPIQLEAVVESSHPLAQDDDKLRGRIIIFEVRVQRVHIEESILARGERNRIDPDKWRPLIMSFQKFYGLAPHELHESTLARIPESMYRSPDVDKGRNASARSETSTHQFIAGAHRKSQAIVECAT